MGERVTDILEDICRNKHGGNQFSEEANSSAYPHKSRQQARVLAFIVASGDLTADEASLTLGIPYTAASARFSELKRDGKIVPSIVDGVQVSRLTRNNKKAGAYRAVLKQHGLRVIIAGSRTLEHPLLVRRAVRESKFKITEVVSGCAPEGADKFGERWAKQNNILVKQFPADWLTHGKAAGMLRNVQMADYADALIAIWDGESVGTRNMIGEMGKRQKPVFVLRFEV